MCSRIDCIQWTNCNQHPWPICIDRTFNQGNRKRQSESGLGQRSNGRVNKYPSRKEEDDPVVPNGPLVAIATVRI
ncbi:uncharacterized protein LOC143221887 isoform X4 [Lasioglossum baleicum]|uniref:uncharacterized protein LOC143221887 isoform X4 n=1 Tax=Lasioglossum baleicum TaxID=434251 RepID=UPI003FCC4A13